MYRRNEQCDNGKRVDDLAEDRTEFCNSYKFSQFELRFHNTGR